MRRVGHKGAAALAPANTRAAFDAALEVGVDMVEFDVLPTAGGELVLAHDPADRDARACETLAEALVHLSADRFAAIELDVDLKAPGYELRVLQALREHGLVERSLVTSQFRESLRVLRGAEQSLRLGLSVPRLRRDPFRHRAALPVVLAGMASYRAALPARMATVIGTGLADAVMAHWRLVTPRLVRAVQGAGGELYVWTVDEPDVLRRIAALGVDGMITNDPRLFAM